MLKTLVKKQFQESFRSYFLDQKTGKSRSKGKVLFYFALFGVLMLFMLVMFFGIAALLGEQLMPAKLTWLFFAMMGVLSLMLGTFGSVFNTFSQLYLAKDNDFLFSLPIPFSKILISRMIHVYGMSLLYSGMVWIPATVYFWIFGQPTWVAVLFDIVLLFLIALLVTVLTCALGWVVAMIARKIKNKSILSTIIAALAMGLYFFFSFHSDELIQGIAQNSTSFADGFRKWGNLLYQLGMGADGDAVPMLLFAAITLAAFAVCVWIMSKTFFMAAEQNAGGPKHAKKKTIRAESHSVQSALLRRELKRFTGSTVYMLNSGFGILFLVFISVMAVLRIEELHNLIFTLNASLGKENLAPIFLVLTVCAISAMNVISTPSVSLEGKTLWVIRSLPIPTSQILQAKINLHLLLNSVPAVLCVIIVGICAEISPLALLLCAAVSVAFIWFGSVGGLMVGILFPNLNWTTEAEPIKRSNNIMISWLIGWVVIILLCAGAFFQTFFSVEICLGIMLLVLLAVAFGLHRWIMTRGVSKFEELSA